MGPSGSVVGIDVSERMLAMARERAVREGVTHLELRTLDAAALAGIEAAGFQAVLARWGLMYMDAPVAALAEARRPRFVWAA